MSERSDILIAGSGAAGLTLGIALAEAGFEVTIVGRLDLRRNGRTVALFEASLRLYRALGLWERLAAQAAPLATIRIIDDTNSAFRPPPVEFEAGEIDLPAFGQNIENADLVAELAAAARQMPGLRLIEGFLTDYDFRPESVAATLEDGRRFEAALIVGADGRGSALRAAAGIGVREWSYRQVALTTILSHAEPHLDTSTEFHTREGPFTLVPLPARAGRPHRSSLVWLMNPSEAERRLALEEAALAAEIEQHAHALLGTMALEGECGSFPMSGLRALRLTAPRLALVGDAGHFFPPIGAQGLNLGLRDVAELVECLEEAAADAGAPAALDRYERRRAADIVSRTLSIDLLNRSLLFDLPPVDFVRAAGMVVVRAIGPLRRAVMREGILPRGRLPRLMCEPGAGTRKSGPASGQTGVHEL
jgi:2-octaprenyl-6-methoxyphenol hydroxylase